MKNKIFSETHRVSLLNRGAVASMGALLAFTASGGRILAQTTLPPALYTEEADFDSNLDATDVNINSSPVAPQDIVSSYSDIRGSGSNLIKFAGLTDPTIEIASSSTSNAAISGGGEYLLFGGASGVATLVYDFEVTSNNSNLTGKVPVSIDASGIVTTSNASSQATIRIELPDLTLDGSPYTANDQVVAGGGTASLTNVLSFNHIISVPLNTPERIYISASTFAGWPENLPNITVPTTAYAFIDPQVSIDPSVADASDYSIEFSANLPPNPIVPSNPGAVPEPSTYGLLAGAALLGLASFRRRRMSAINAS